MTQILDVKRGLADRARAVCEMLLPNGRLVSGEWEVGSVGGEAGKSLKVCITGNKAGVWADFAAGTGGDLIDLWMGARNLSLVETLDEAREYLGLEKPTFTRPEKRYNRPQKPKCSEPKSAVLDYLTVDRNIPADILKKYKIGERDNTIIFPFLRNGELVMAKEREAVDGAKPKPTEAGCEKILFGWQAIDSKTRMVVISEGEIDTLSWAAYGYQALSVPFGGGKGNKQDWIENEYDNLDRFEQIYIAMDDDEPGREAAEEIISRLGRHRCFVVTLPHKDANECLMAGVPKEAIDAAVSKAETVAPAALSRVKDYYNNVVKLFWPDPNEKMGYTFEQTTVHGKLIFRPGEITVWTGSAGSGKSQMISDCSIGWMKHGGVICLASLEMAPAQTLKRMVKQAGGTDRPTEPFIKIITDWLHDGLIIYSIVGKERLKELLEAFDYARSRYGCDIFVIDSFMRLGIASDDYTGQERAMFEIVTWAIDRDVHIHLVAHSRKQGPNEKGPQDIESVKGASEIGANAFNIISVWRDRNWEELNEGGDTKDSGYMDSGGVIMNVSKQRNGDWTGKVRLHFDVATYQYRCNKSPLGPRRAVVFPDAKLNVDL